MTPATTTLLTACLLMLINNSCRAQEEGNATNNIDPVDVSRYNCEWAPCNAIGYATEINTFTIDCCTLQLPLDYAQPEGRTINVSMTRLTPPQSSGNTMFMFTGGPGNSGWQVINGIPYMIQPSWGVTVVIPDNRGTGLSTRLACDDNDSQDLSAACITYLVSKFGEQGLKSFSMTNTARDIGVQIQTYKKQSEDRIGVMGSSYGTHCLNRFLSVYPNLVDAAVMDGVVNPLMGSNSRNALWQSLTAEQFLTYCQVLPECNQYFMRGETPQNALRTILKQLDTNQQPCIRANFAKYQITPMVLRRLMNNLIVPSEMYYDRTIIPAVIWRLGRCNTDDVRALDFFFKKYLGAAATPPRDPNGDGFQISQVLRQHVANAEEWVVNLPEVDMDTLMSWYNASIAASPNFFQPQLLRDIWPRPDRDQYDGQIARFTPLLMINGLLDGSTFFHETAQLATLTPERAFHAVPLAGHVTGNLASVGIMCPSRLMLSSLFPATMGEPDISCLRDMPTTIDFVGATPQGQQYSMSNLNVSRPFGN